MKHDDFWLEYQDGASQITTIVGLKLTNLPHSSIMARQISIFECPKNTRIWKICLAADMLRMECDEMVLIVILKIIEEKVGLLK